MNSDQNAKFPLHEAAREGKSLYYWFPYDEFLLTA
jgi:hypothetical protein